MIVLASQSAVRAKLLADAGVVFETASPGVDEDRIKRRMTGSSPKQVAETLADAKALALTRGDDLIIGADQTLEFHGRLFDKAQEKAEARERLAMLRGKTHELHAAVALAQGGAVIWRWAVTASLTMREFSDAFLDDYMERTGGALSSVGCYELEGAGAQLFSHIEGDYFGILGLPLLPLLEALRRAGALKP